MRIASEAIFGYPCNYEQRGITEDFKRQVFEYDVIQALDYYEFGANVARVGYKNLFIYLNENVPFNKMYQGHMLENKRIIQEKACHFVAVSKSIRDCLLEEGVVYERISTIPFWVTPRIYQPLNITRKYAGERLGFNLGEEVFISLFVGRKSPSKGLIELIEAVEDLPTKLVCAGPDEGVRIPDGVIEFDELGTEQLLLLYNIADVLILPSIPTPYWVEQFGRVILEAAACGCPSISTNLGGPRDLIKNWETGFLIPPWEVGALKEAIKYLIDNPQVKFRFGKAARRMFEVEFWPDDIDKRLQKCFEEKAVLD